MRTMWLVILMGGAASSDTVGTESDISTTDIQEMQEIDEASENNNSEELQEEYDISEEYESEESEEEYKDAYSLFTSPPPNLIHKNKILVDSLLHLTTTMLSQLLEHLSENLLFSPLSAHVALGMVLNGGGGETKKQLKKGLGLDPEDGVKELNSEYGNVLKNFNGSENFQLESANRPFLGKKSSEEFDRNIEDTFGSKPLMMDFKNDKENARNIINQFVEKKTNGKILNLITEKAMETINAFVIVNAIYFKGSWKYKFDKKLTAKKPFYPAGDEKISVDMMKMRRPIKAVYKRLETISAKVLKLPFAGQRMSMILILPEKRHQLAAVEERIQKVGVKKLLKDLEKATIDNKTVNVNVFLPKFITTKTLSLKTSLEKLGMTDMFSENADFQKMMEDKSERLKVSEVLQKLQLSVSEEGAEAAAATAVVGSVFKSTPVPIHFKCDEPFLFLLRDDLTKMLLFAGKIVNPNKAE